MLPVSMITLDPRGETVRPGIIATLCHRISPPSGEGRLARRVRRDMRYLTRTTAGQLALLALLAGLVALSSGAVLLSLGGVRPAVADAIR